MQKKTIIYIDGNNLYRSAKRLGYTIDFRKFHGWLRQKYNSNRVYMFLGYIPKRIDLYCRLRDSGFIIIFKQTIVVGQIIKGNCDAELVLQVVSDFYMKKYEFAILITGDGDFGCLVRFLNERNALQCILAPDKKSCSYLLRKQNIKITFLDDLYHYFSNWQ